MKMLSPGFPPRRPAGFVRYILLAGIVLVIFYMFHGGSDDKLSYPDQSKSAVDTTTSDEHSNTKLRPEVKLPGSKAAGQDPKLQTDPSKPPKSGSKTGSPTQLEDEDIVDYDFSSPKFQEEDDDDDYRPSNGAGSKSKAAGGDEFGYLATTKASGASKAKATGVSKSAGSKASAAAADTPEEEDSKATPGGSSKSKQTSASNFASDEGGHPIEKLIYDAQLNFAELLSKESKSLDQAAQAYRKRRGRHPPPGFDKWYEFATQHKAVIVEEFFDQVYHDLEPFWGLPPSFIRKESSEFEMTINVRDGKATAGSDWFWTQIWLNLIKTIEHLLPDMDLALNAMDEPRLVAPWEDINAFMKKAAKTRGFPKSSEVISKFQNLTAPGTLDKEVVIQDKAWEGTKPYWPVARRGCAPDSPAREAPLQKSFKEPPVINASNADAHSYLGYVSNFTLSAELCHQPDLQGLEGILINPLTTSASKVFFPMFGGSKLTVNNEILLPAPMYWNEEERFTGGDDHGTEWKNKEDKVIWRGVATGGKNTPDNWRGFQRHRFIAMNNGTTVSLAEAGAEEPQNFALPSKQYNVKAQKDKALGDWVNEWSDCSFIDLMCDPPTEDGTCSYTEPYYHITPGMKMSEQFNNKYLPDIDGNSFSGRYLGFLRSTSLPVKATLWREWHDSRIVAWKHFVPMDSRFGDWYGIMDYFMGYNGKDGHDRAAEKIANEGKEWAEQVLRKEDMQIYVLRLLLEYARLLDDNRENLGWVGDAVKDPSIEKTWGTQ